MKLAPRLGSTITLATLVTLALLVPARAETAKEKVKEDASTADASVEEAPPGASAAPAAPPQPPTPPQPGEVKLQIGATQDDDDYDGKEDIVLIGQSKTVEHGEVVTGDVVIVGGDLTVHGEVKGDAVCVGGTLTLGPDAVIHGDCVNVGGSGDIDPGAKVKGDQVNVVGIPLGPIKHLKKFEKWDHESHHHKGKTFTGRLVKLISELAFFLFLMFLALLMHVFMPRQLGRIDDHLSGDFPRSALLGLAVMLLLPLACIILAVTIVGIPLVPLLLLAVVITGLMGYIAFGRVLGRKLVGEKHVMLQILVGLALLQAASILGDLIALPGGSFLLVAGIFKAIGAIIFIGGFFLGLGAVIYSRWGKRTLAQTQAARTPNGNSGSTPPNADSTTT